MYSFFFVLFWYRQPQVTWDCERYIGFVDMHRPEAWGYLVFGDDDDDSSNDGTITADTEGVQEEPRDDSWPARLAALQVYYAQHKYRDRQGVFAKDVQDLREFLSDEIMSPFEVISMAQQKEDGFRAVVSLKQDNRTKGLSNIAVMVSDDRLVEEFRNEKAAKIQ